MTRQVANSTLRTLLEQVAQDTTSIMVFVGSLHSDSQRPGEKHQSDERVAERARPRFQPARARGPDSLIVDRAQAHQRRLVMSLETYNAKGEQIAILFSKRKDHKEESEAWRQRLAVL